MDPTGLLDAVLAVAVYLGRPCWRSPLSCTAASPGTPVRPGRPDRCRRRACWPPSRRRCGRRRCSPSSVRRRCACRRAAELPGNVIVVVVLLAVAVDLGAASARVLRARCRGRCAGSRPGGRGGARSALSPSAVPVARRRWQRGSQRPSCWCSRPPRPRRAVPRPLLQPRSRWPPPPWWFPPSSMMPRRSRAPPRLLGVVALSGVAGAAARSLDGACARHGRPGRRPRGTTLALLSGHG